MVSFRSRSPSIQLVRFARNVHDVAIALGILTGIDAADAATEKSEGRVETDYTKYLRRDALNGARIGVVRDFTGQDPDVDWIGERPASPQCGEQARPSWMSGCLDGFSKRRGSSITPFDSRVHRADCTVT